MRRAPQNVTLVASELRIRRELQGASASPFVAHAYLDSKKREIVAAALVEFVGRTPEGLVRALDLYPASTAWLIATTLLDHYGLDNHRIYDPVAAAFGMNSVPSAIRERLNLAFRKACAKLGLITAGGNAIGYVDDYILQAGVARSQLRALIEAFMRAEAVIGPPPDDDTQRLYAWEVRAADFAPQGLTRLRNIMRWDESAYHAGAYARAGRNSPPQTPFEGAVAETIATILTEKHFDRALPNEPPRLLFIEDGMVIAAPAAMGILVQLGDREKRIAAGRRINIAPPWPEHVAWRREDNADLLSIPVLGPGAPVAVFDAESGDLLQSIGAADARRTFAIDAREVVLVARQAFHVGSRHSIDLGPGAHGLNIDISGGIELTIGPVAFVLRLPSRPMIAIVAQRVAKSPRGGLFTAPDRLLITFPDGRPDGQLSVRIEHPALSASLEIPLPDQLLELEFKLDTRLPARGVAGLLQTSVGFAGGGRVLVRASYWIWPGLRSIEDQTKFDGPVPSNFVLHKSSHLFVDDTARICLNLHDTFRYATLAFRDRNATEYAFFDVPRPGTTLALVDEDGREAPIAAGSKLSLVPGSTNALVIRSDDADASLDIRGTIHQQAFGRSGTRRIALATMLGQAPHDEIRVWPRGDSRRAVTLVELAPATSPIEFKTDRDRRNGQLQVAVRFAMLVDAARIIVTNLAGGPEIEVDVAVGRRPVEHGDTHLIDGALSAADAGSSALSLRLANQDYWPELGVGELAVRRDGDTRWNRLRNARGDSYVIKLASNFPKAPIVAGEPGSAAIFLRLTDLMNRCYAPECWSDLQALQGFWRDLGHALLPLPDGRRTLLRSWARALPIDSNSSWVPIRHPIEIAPDLLSSEMADFQVFDETGEDFHELGQLRHVAECERPQDALAALSINPTFFTAFHNFALVNQNPAARLLGFEFSDFLRNTAGERDELAALWKPRDRRLTRRHHS